VRQNGNQFLTLSKFNSAVQSDRTGHPCGSCGRVQVSGVDSEDDPFQTQKK